MIGRVLFDDALKAAGDHGIGMKFAESRIRNGGKLYGCNGYKALTGE